MSGTKKERLCYIDMLRIIACFLVVLNHTPGYIQCFEHEKGALSTLVILHLFLGMVVKIGVPVFFMISGSLLLGKNYQIRDVLKKALKFFFILLGFSLVANVVYSGKLYVPGFIRTFASADVDGAGPYWYLYAYIGVLLILPFLSFIAQNLDIKLVNYLILLRVVIIGVISMLFLFANSVMDSNMHLAPEFNPAIVVVDCIFYPIVGYGLDKKLDIASLKGKGIRRQLFIFFGTILLEGLLTWFAGFDNVFNGFDCLITISLFLVIKYFFSVKEISERARSVITTIGAVTFGIYLLDPVIGDILEPWIHKLYPLIPSLLLVSVIHTIISMIVNGTLTYVWRIIKNGCVKAFKKQ